MILGKPSLWVFKTLTLLWKSHNDENFYKAKCFKILTADPKDDVIDNFASL
jgi:hypothetical protein